MAKSGKQTNKQRSSKVTTHKTSKTAKKQPNSEGSTWPEAVRSKFNEYRSAYAAYTAEEKKRQKYRSFRLQKRIKPQPRVIPTSYELLKSTLGFLYRHKALFFVLFCVHAALYMSFVRSPIETDINSIQTSVKTILADKGELQKNVATLGAVLNTTSASQSSSSTLTVIVVCMSLIYIWAIRAIYEQKAIRARDAIYQGMAPLASSLVILVVISLQLIPFAVTSFVYATARANGLFTSGFEDLSLFIICMLAALLSFYFITSSVIALYIGTLQGVYPLEALRAGRKLVQFQRFAVFRRILALPLIIMSAYFITLLVFIRIASGQVFLVADILQLLILPVVHIYLFKLYRALL